MFELAFKSPGKRGQKETFLLTESLSDDNDENGWGEKD